MREPRRIDNPRPDAADDRDSRTEALLVGGLDRYFSGRYEEAIHIWTRVLFLDRAHARARAYIDRARTAISERQRHSEEMLQASRDLLERGQVEAARHLLTEAVATGGEDEHAAALRLKLDRLERAQAAMRPGPSAPAVDRTIDGWTWHGPSRLLSRLTAIAAVLLVVALASPMIREWVGVGSTAESLDALRRPVALPLLSSSEVAIVRARNLFNLGHLAEALLVLDRVSPNSPVRNEADTLRVEIQRLLLASGRDRPAPRGLERQ